MGLNTEIRRIVRDEFKQLEGALRNGTTPPPLGSNAQPAAARHPSVPDTGAGGAGDRSDRRANEGRRRIDRGREVLRWILEELKALRDERGVPRTYVSRTEAQRILGCGRTKIAELCRKRVFDDTFKEGKRRMIAVRSIERYIAQQLEKARPERDRSLGQQTKSERREKTAQEGQGHLAAAIAALDVK